MPDTSKHPHTSVLVTLANGDFLDQAKQLFSSVYWNAGWKGDYMLLAHEDVPEEGLRWFRERGVLVYKIKPISDASYKGKCSGVVFDKFSLFTPYFKQWKYVVYLDADVIVRSSIDGLLRFRGFSAVPDGFSEELRREFTRPIVSLRRGYDLKSPVFNSGVFVMETECVPDDAFEKLLELNRRYAPYVRYGEQAILNLYWFRKWRRLPETYNVLVNHNQYRNVPPARFRNAVIVHFAWKPKPWDPKNAFCREWERNLERADLIDVRSVPSPAVALRPFMVLVYGIFLKILGGAWKMRKMRRKAIPGAKEKWFRAMYRVGRIVKKISPALYYALGGKN